MNKNEAKNQVNNIADTLFSNPGAKIKLLAIINFVILAAGTVLGAFAIGSVLESLMLMILVLIAGGLTAYIMSLFLYGFGELIENTTALKNNTSVANAAAASGNVSARDAGLDELPEL